MAKRKSGRPTPEKAREILRDGTVHGRTLTQRQRGFFGAVAGKKPTPRARRG